MVTTTALLVAGTVMAAAGAGYQAYSGYQARKDQQEQLEKQAVMEKEAAVGEARGVMDKARRVLGKQEAALAASGIKLGDGGSGDILTGETKQLAEEDALAVMQGGSARAGLLRGEARNAGRAATASLVSGGLSIGSTVVGGLRGYRTANLAQQQANEANAMATASNPPRPSLLTGRYSLGAGGAP